jgi:aminopeptidase YwaD
MSSLRSATMIRLPALAAAGAAAALAVAGPAAAEVSGIRAKATVVRIASLGPRVAGSENERRAGRIVAERLRALGYGVVVQRVPLPEGGASRNVVARSPGRLRAVVVAHLDGVSGTVAANDNASGVAVMLEVARTLRGTDGVLLAALGAEERHETGSPLHLGSARLVRALSRSDRGSIRLALSLDMVGVGGTLNVRGLERRPNSSARLTLERARLLGFRASYLRDEGVSDHAELTRAGIPAALFTWRWDRCWHRPCDRPRRVKPWKLQPVGRTVVAAVRAAVSR